jgi:hypothetical protein
VSWDIFVQDLPKDAKSVADIPDDFEAQPIGRRKEIIEGIRRVIPDMDMSDPTWLTIDGPDWSIEVNIGNGEILESFAFHVRGGDLAAAVVADILQELGLRALDPSSETGIFDPTTAKESLQRWRKYRNQIIDKD